MYYNQGSEADVKIVFIWR